MLVFVILLAIVSLISIIMVYVANKDSGQLKTMRFLLVFLFAALVMSACGLVGSSPVSMTFFYVFQVVFIGLGYLVSFLLKKNFFGEFTNEKVGRSLFVLAITTAGMAGFTFVFDHVSKLGLAPYYSLSLFTFVLPQFMAVSFDAYAGIPQEIYKVWYYPDEEKEIDFDKIDTSKIFMLEMEFSKSLNDTRLVNSKAKAPLGMQFGDWFMSFIENYNHKFDQEPIVYLNPDNTPHGWIFYVKPSLLGTAKYIDPDVSISANKISEKNVIIARRVGIV